MKAKVLRAVLATGNHAEQGQGLQLTPALISTTVEREQNKGSVWKWTCAVSKRMNNMQLSFYAYAMCSTSEMPQRFCSFQMRSQQRALRQWITWQGSLWESRPYFFFFIASNLPSALLGAVCSPYPPPSPNFRSTLCTHTVMHSLVWLLSVSTFCYSRTHSRAIENIAA